MFMFARLENGTEITGIVLINSAHVVKVQPGEDGKSYIWMVGDHETPSLFVRADIQELQRQLNFTY